MQKDNRIKRLGAFVECASNSVPRVETLKRFARVLSAFGYNELYLGTADTYEIESEPYFGYLRGRYSQAELREVDAYCRGIGVELVPAIQTLAHLHFLPNYAAYRDCFDAFHILLAEDERVYALIDKMFASAAASYTSRRIHIGMDEAFWLGQGKYLEQHGYTEKGEIMARHLARVAEIASKYGFTCEIWSDMFVRRDGTVQVPAGELPENVRLVYWNYLKTEEERLERVLDAHKRLTPNVGYAGGVWKWMGFAPDNAYSMAMGGNALAACRASGVDSFLVTLWADNGGEASLFSALPGLYWYAEAAAGRAASSVDFDKERFQRITGVPFYTFLLLDKPNKPSPVKTYEGLNNKCFFYLYNDPLYGAFDSLLSEGISEDYMDAAEQLLRAKGGEYGYVFRTLGLLCGVLEMKADLAKRIRAAYEAGDRAALTDIAERVLPELDARLSAFFEAFSDQWRRENKPFGFETQCARLGGLQKRLDETRKTLLRFLSGARETIEELEAPALPFGYDADATEDGYVLMTWSKIVTPGFI